MADQYIAVATTAGGPKVDVSEIVVGSNTVERQRVILGDPTSAMGFAPVSATTGLGVFNPLETGTWSYVAGTLTSGSLTGTGRCVGIRVFASGADGSFNVNGGNMIIVRLGCGVDWLPRGNLLAPVIAWMSGTIDVVIEGVT